MSVQNVSVDASPSPSLPLPTGASTAAKQPALGTAGSPSTDVISIQGVVSGTAVPVSGTVSTNPSIATRSDTYTTAATGTTVNVSTTSAKTFSIHIKGTGAAATLWNVVLEGSLDNVNFTTVLTHTNTTGDGIVLYSGATLYPSLYFRSRCVSITLGSATNIVVTILGVA